MVREAINKTKLAKDLGISRSSLYYKPKRGEIDQEVKEQIESVLAEHPAYGHKRIALHLRLNKKRIRRVMRKYGLRPYRRKSSLPKKRRDRGRRETPYSNKAKGTKVDKPDIVWETDFTFVRFHCRFIYLATVIDVFTRELLGINISRFHNRFLVIGAVLGALDTGRVPKIIHSDQGSEYDSKDFYNLLSSSNIEISMSRKASPWENGHQESFFGHLKAEAGDLSRFETLGELVAYLYQMVYYYNYKRIHTELKMPPVAFKGNFDKEHIKSSS